MDWDASDTTLSWNELPEGKGGESPLELAGENSREGGNSLPLD